MNLRLLDDKTLAVSFDETHLEARQTIRCFEMLLYNMLQHQRDKSMMNQNDFMEKYDWLQANFAQLTAQADVKALVAALKAAGAASGSPSSLPVTVDGKLPADFARPGAPRTCRSWTVFMDVLTDLTVDS